MATGKQSIAQVQAKINDLVDTINLKGPSLARARKLRELKELRDKLEGLEPLGNPGNRRKKRNPVSAAASLSEAWHGRPAKTQREVVEELHEHGVLADLGRLEELEVSVGRKKVVPLADFGACRLASNEAGTQLYLVGGDQSIDLRALGIDTDKEFVPLGECAAITYHTAKHHLGEEDKTPGAYRHEFGEEGGDRPILIYDVRNKLLSLVGGSYVIKRDIRGKYSAGLRD